MKPFFFKCKLNIHDKDLRVKFICEKCGNDSEIDVFTYHDSKNHYCQNCRVKKKEKGKDSQFYNRIKTVCTNCGKEIEIIPYDYYKRKNKYGDNHNFCSHECYWQYRKGYYVGEKSTMANFEWTDEMKEKQKLTVIKNARSGKRFDSKIQLLINDVLDSNNIKYEREYLIEYYAVDNYLTEYNLPIEVMGDYWHVSPLKYNEDGYSISEVQQKDLKHDKQKHTYIKNHLNVEILYLWEYDIEHNIDLCEKLIQEYISKNGILENYHSFNWSLENDKLVLNKEIIIPYQDMSIDQYRHLIKIKNKNKEEKKAG